MKLACVTTAMMVLWVTRKSLELLARDFLYIFLTNSLGPKANHLRELLL